MKVDVEAHQPRAFTNSSAAKFLQVIDVPLILMEWNLCKGQNISSEVHDLIRFFTTRQYQVFSEDNRRLGPDCCQRSSNVVFTKLSVDF